MSVDGLPAAGAALDATGARVEWQRFSRVTPWLGMLRMWGGVLVAVAFFFREKLANSEVARILRDSLTGSVVSVAWKVCVVLAVASLGLTLIAWVSWRHARFALVEDGIHFRKGVLLTKHAHVRWDRVQTVDVDRSVLARLFGRGSVTVVDASADNVGIKLGLLGRKECESLRQAILVACDQARNSQPIVLPAWREGDVMRDDPTVIYRVDPSRLILSSLLSPQMFGGLLSVIGSILLLYFEDGIAAVPLLFIVLGALGSAIGSVARSWGTEVGLAHEGVRLRSGLISVGTVIVPPGRVHAIKISQPFLWRPWGWWRLSVLVAGRNEFNRASATVVPVGSRRDMEAIVWAVLADLGVEDRHALLEEAFEGSGSGRLFLAAPRASRLVDPFGWERNGIALTRTAAVLRRGKILNRSIRVVQHDHFQGLKLRSGPISRRLGLADLKFATVGMGPSIVQRHLSRGDAARTLQRELDLGRGVRARGERESIERWRLRMGIPSAEESAKPTPTAPVESGAGEGVEGHGGLGQTYGDAAAGRVGLPAGSSTGRENRRDDV